MSRSSTSSSDADGLVSAPRDLARSGWRRATALVVVGLFLLITGGAGILDLFAPASGPSLTRSDRAIRRQDRAAASIDDGSLMKILDRELQEHSNVRQALVPWYIAHGLLPLREGGSGVLVGRDGWLFLEDRIHPAGGTYHPDYGALAANTLTAIDRRLAAMGIETVFLLVPRKATVATLFLPPGAEPGPAFEQDILRLLRQRAIAHVDLYDVWEDLASVQVWQRQDTHWSTLGMWLALEASARALGRWVPPEERSSILQEDVPIPVERKLLMTLGIPRDHAVLETLSHEDLPGPRIVTDSLDRLPTEGPDVFLVGTSFSNPDSATRQLSHLVDHPVTNLAEAATHAGVTLGKALSEGRIPAASQLVLEIPSFQLEGRASLVEYPRELQPAALQALVLAEPPRWHGLAPTFVDKPGNRSALPDRMLATTGDGIAHLELSGKPDGTGPLQVTLGTGGTRLRLAWPPEKDILHIPIITSGVGAPWLAVHLDGAPAGHSIQVRLVTELDLEHALPLARTRVQPTAEGWYQDRPLPPGALGSRHAALWIDLAPRGVVGPLYVQLIREDGEPHLIGPVPLRLGGTALLRLSAPTGNWTTVRIWGSGTRPGRVGDVRIVDLPAR